MNLNRETETCKKLTGRITKLQKLRLLDLMNSNRSVGRGQYTTKSGSIKLELCWKNAASELNSMSDRKKGPEQWKRCWIDRKAAVKKQYNKVKPFKKKTGNRPSSEGAKPLEKMDEEFIQFFSEDLVERVGATPEAGFNEKTTCINFSVNEQTLADAGSTTGVEVETPNIIEHLSNMIEEPSQPEEKPTSSAVSTRETRQAAITPQGKSVSSFKSCFEEAKKYVDQQNNAILEELKKMNANMLNLLTVLKEIKEKLN